VNKRKKTPPRKITDSWERALTCPLSPDIGYECLQNLRLAVVKYLNWVTHDFVLEEPEQALREIQRVADRLTRITAMIPDAVARSMQEYEAQIRRLSNEGGVDRSFDARIAAGRLNIERDDENIPPEDIPF
jgi:hypothetical protein